jgi:hypothetical protein
MRKFSDDLGTFASPIMRKLLALRMTLSSATATVWYSW